MHTSFGMPKRHYDTSVAESDVGRVYSKSPSIEGGYQRRLVVRVVAVGDAVTVRNLARRTRS